MARCDEHVARYADHCAGYRSSMMIDFLYLVCVWKLRKAFVLFFVCRNIHSTKAKKIDGQQRSIPSHPGEREREKGEKESERLVGLFPNHAQSDRVCDRPTLSKVNHLHTFVTFYSNSILLRNGIYGSWIRPKDYMLYACQLQHLHKSFRFSLALSHSLSASFALFVYPAPTEFPLYVPICL